MEAKEDTPPRFFVTRSFTCLRTSPFGNLVLFLLLVLAAVGTFYAVAAGFMKDIAARKSPGALAFVD